MGYRRFHFLKLVIHIALFYSNSIQTLKLVYVISSSLQFSSRSIELILKNFLNYSAEENPCCIFSRLGLLISSSSILLSLFYIQISYKLSSTTQNPFPILKESSNCHNEYKLPSYKSCCHVLFWFAIDRTLHQHERVLLQHT